MADQRRARALACRPRNETEPSRASAATCGGSGRTLAGPRCASSRTGPPRSEEGTVDQMDAESAVRPLSRTSPRPLLEALESLQCRRWPGARSERIEEPPLPRVRQDRDVTRAETEVADVVTGPAKFVTYTMDAQPDRHQGRRDGPRRAERRTSAGHLFGPDWMTSRPSLPTARDAAEPLEEARSTAGPCETVIDQPSPLPRSSATVRCPCDTASPAAMTTLHDVSMQALADADSDSDRGNRGGHPAKAGSPDPANGLGQGRCRCSAADQARGPQRHCGRGPADQ